MSVLQNFGLVFAGVKDDIKNVSVTESVIGCSEILRKFIRITSAVFVIAAHWVKRRMDAFFAERNQKRIQISGIEIIENTAYISDGNQNIGAFEKSLADE